MSSSETRTAPKSGLLLSAAVCAAASMVLTLLLMLGISALIASGRLPVNREAELVMLCVFLGTLFSVLLTGKKQRGGLLPYAGMSWLIYAVLLLIFAISAKGSGPNAALCLKTDVCALAGAMLGSALDLRQKARPKKHHRKK